MAGPTFPNGRAPAAELVDIAPDVPLWSGTANAWARLKAAAAAAGIDIWPAGLASGYRSLFVQQDMHDRPELYDLNPQSSVSLASAGNSTHGWGTRVDIGSFFGDRASWLLANAGRFGFSREFGALDPNHFAHDGFTAVEPITSGGFAGEGTRSIMTINGGADSDDDKALRSILQRAFKYHVRENETTGPTLWERLSTIVGRFDAADKRREQINQRNEDIHAAQAKMLDALLAAARAGTPGTIQTVFGASPEQVRDIVREELGQLVLGFAPRESA